MVVYRDTREIVAVGGVGGWLEFNVPTTEPDRLIQDDGKARIDHRDNPTRLDVVQWEIEHDYTNKLLHISGGGGSASRRRVNDDWRFTAVVQFDASYVLSPEHVDYKPDSPFPDDKFHGIEKAKFIVGIRFAIGEFTRFPTGQAPFYFCPEVLLQRVSVVDTSDMENPDIVRFLVKGEGSAPLERWIGDVRKGIGAIGNPPDPAEGSAPMEHPDAPFYGLDQWPTGSIGPGGQFDRDQ